MTKRFNALKDFVESKKFKGYDPYDGLNSPVIKKTILGKSRFFRLAWIQLFKKNPINLRSLVGVKEEENPKGLGLFLHGYCNLYELEEKVEYLEKIQYLVERIDATQTKGYSGACWGYNFDWQARAFFQPKGTPTVVATSFIAAALIRAYKITSSARCLELALSSVEFVLQDLNRTYDDDGDFSFSYSPADHTQVYNASLLGARLLAELSQYDKRPILLEEAKKAVNYAVKAQQENGSWGYGTLPFHQWVDNFHTGYNLECIFEYQQFSGDVTYAEAISKGLEYYVNTFFTEEGISKYYNNSVYPVDIHAPAQLFVTLQKLGVFADHATLAKRVLEWTEKHMQSSKGYFYYQKSKLYTSKVPFIRWAQGWMFYGYSYYFKGIGEVKK